MKKKVSSKNKFKVKKIRKISKLRRISLGIFNITQVKCRLLSSSLSTCTTLSSLPIASLSHLNPKFLNYTFRFFKPYIVFSKLAEPIFLPLFSWFYKFEKDNIKLKVKEEIKQSFKSKRLDTVPPTFVAQSVYQSFITRKEIQIRSLFKDVQQNESLRIELLTRIRALRRYLVFPFSSYYFMQTKSVIKFNIFTLFVSFLKKNCRSFNRFVSLIWSIYPQLRDLKIPILNHSVRLRSNLKSKPESPNFRSHNKMGYIRSHSMNLFSSLVQNNNILSIVRSKYKNNYDRTQFPLINFHKVFLHTLNIIRTRTFKYSSIRSRLLNSPIRQIQIVYSLYQSRVVHVNLIDPVTGLNLFSSVPRQTRNYITSIVGKAKASKYLFLLSLDKYKVDVNPYARTLAILQASKRLFKILRRGIFSLQLIYKLPKHIVDSNLIFNSLSSFIQQWSYLIPIKKSRFSRITRKALSFRLYKIKFLFRLYHTRFMSILGSSSLVLILNVFCDLFKMLKHFLFKVSKSTSNFYKGFLMSFKQKFRIFFLDFFLNLNSVFSNNFRYTSIKHSLFKKFMTRLQPRLKFFRMQRLLYVNSILTYGTVSHGKPLRVRSNKR